MKEIIPERFCLGMFPSFLLPFLAKEKARFLISFQDNGIDILFAQGVV